MIAEVLRLFGHDVRTVDEVFPGRPEGVDDEEIIPWLAANDVVWITADLARKKENKEQREYDLKTQRVSAFWIHQPKEGLSNWQEVKIVVRCFDFIHGKLSSDWKARHFSASLHGGPEMLWVEPVAIQGEGDSGDAQ